MARAPRTPRDPIGDKLREIEALDRLGLLAPRTGLLQPDPSPAAGGGLLSAVSGRRTPINPGGHPVAPPDMQAERNNGAVLQAAVDAKPNFGDPGPRGLLAPPETPKSGGLLASVMGQSPTAAPQPSRQPAQSQRPSLWSTLDDVLFGGAAGERASERRVRDQGEAAQAAHRDAFAAASAGGSFDPAAYQARMAELGQAPDLSGLTQLEGMTDSQDVRGFRGRAERRNVTAGALAPTLGAPEDQQPAAFQGAADYLASEGYGFDPATSPAAVASMVGGAMGADPFLDNRRGDRAQGEQERSAQAAERYRAQDLGFRQSESAADRSFRESRAAADDQYRYDALDVTKLGITTPNSTGDVMAPILNKIATMGIEALTPGEAAIWQNYQRSSQQPYGGGYPGVGAPLPGVPATGGAPVASAPQPPAAVAAPTARDPFPGIREGDVVTQDGVRYMRRGNQMVPAN